MRDFGLADAGVKVGAIAQKALKSADRLRAVIVNARNGFRELTSTSDRQEIHTVCNKADRSLAYVRSELSKIKNTAAEEKVREVWQDVNALEDILYDWRTAYPDDTSPIRINNTNSFGQPEEKLNAPTLIAYTIALVNRVFEGAARRGSGVLLKMLKLFGYSFISLVGQPNYIQRKALNDIPESIQTVEKALNLDVQSIPYAVCPRCSFTHIPTYPNGPSDPVYPTHCNERLTELSDPCGTDLLQEGKPIKVYHAYSFYEWFGRFIAHPGIEQYGDRFCDDIASFEKIPDTKRDIKDGSFVHTFRGHDGKLFLAERGNEGRWVFLLHADFFNVEGNRIRGKTRSTGITSLVCLNLPLSMRNDPAWIFIPGLIQGKSEPDAKNSEHRHYWRLLIDEFSAGYSRGLQPHHTYRSRCSGEGLNERVFRVAIAGVLMDFKAARPFAGFLDVTSHHTCFLCKCWHRAHLGRTDFQNWKTAAVEFLKRGAEAWLNAKTPKEREEIEFFYGTRYSELWRLPYWNPIKQLLVDPMHIFFLILMQRLAREVLGLDNPESSEEEHRKSKTSKKSQQKNSFISFYHDFTPPPHSSELTSSIDTTATVPESLGLDEPEAVDQRLSVLEWGNLPSAEQTARVARMEQLKEEIQGNPRAFQGISDLHYLLSQGLPVSKLHCDRLRKRLGKFKWVVLAYVCNDLMEFPDEKMEIRLQPRFHSGGKKGISRREFGDALYRWLLERIVNPGQTFEWPHFTPKDKPAPSIPWLQLHNIHENQRMDPLRVPGSEGRLELLAETIKRFNWHSSHSVGHIHRFLIQPIDELVGDKQLKVNLNRQTLIALSFVCIDLDILPEGKFGKTELINQLVKWRLTKLLKPLPRVCIASDKVLQMVQKSIRETVVPSWITRPPSDMGLQQAGTLKADHWRVLFNIHLPFSLIRMWGKGSPSAVDNAAEMTPVLETSMHLTCASILMTRNSLSPKTRDQFRSSLRDHILGLKQIFPGFMLPTHHLAFHIYDFMDGFSTVRNWWGFPFERLIGKVQRMPTNHKIGQLEYTLLKVFYKGALFRRWLMRPDCPDILKLCKYLLDKAYGYNTVESDEDDSDVLDGTEVAEMMEGKSNNPPPGHKVISGSVKLPLKLAKRVGNLQPRCYSQIPAAKGFYSIPSRVVGNSYVCYHQTKDVQKPWVAGQIQYIFEDEGEIKLAIRPSKPFTGHRDPFAQFVDQGFDCRAVSSQFLDCYDIVTVDFIVGHTARWEIEADFVVVLSLGWVSCSFIYTLSQEN
ncbi:hypothetical protein HHX47_DHR4000563 [Lentinula edodes]|nr:hypothetical protein HHX47_DHR4000563 [Lentinula edodes]